MKLPKRFALSTLLLLMLVVASIFGYAQWRRQWLLRSEKQLEAQGANLLIGDDWFWPTLSSSASLKLDKNSDGTYQVGIERLPESEAKGRYRAVAARVHDMGVKHIRIFIDAPPLADGMMMSHYVGEDWLE